MCSSDLSGSVPLRFEVSRFGVPLGESSRDGIHGKDASHESWLDARSEEIDEHFFFCCSTEGYMVFKLGDVGFEREIFGDMGGDEPVSGFTLDVSMYEGGLKFLDEYVEGPEAWGSSFEGVLDNSGGPGLCGPLFHEG